MAAVKSKPMAAKPAGKWKLGNMTDTNMLLSITVVVFFLMYIGAILFSGRRLFKTTDFFLIF